MIGRHGSGRGLWLLFAASCALVASCATPAASVEPQGQEIVVCGRTIPIGARVVLWRDPGGYDAYRTRRAFEDPRRVVSDAGVGAVGPRYGARSPASIEIDRAVARDGWTLENLRRQVDQIVVHYDAAGTSRACFRILHDVRGLSAHFLIDLDGTIYQTLDVRERAWHATIANDRSVGIEMANIGAFPPGDTATLGRWYASDERGTMISLPPDVGSGGVAGPGPFRPARRGPIAGTVQGRALVMQDFTPQQYIALERLIAGLCVTLPRIDCDYPREASGTVCAGVLGPARWSSFRGILGHYHVQENKVDPGPAFDWDRVIDEARRCMSGR